MPKSSSCAQPDAASIAANALYALQRGCAADLEEALARAERQAHQLVVLDSGETERIDVLRGALQALAGGNQDQIQAGTYLLGHLASGPALTRAALQTA